MMVEVSFPSTILLRKSRIVREGAILRDARCARALRVIRLHELRFGPTEEVVES